MSSVVPHTVFPYPPLLIHPVGYNAYVDTIGHAIGAGACVAVRRGNKVYTIADDMPLLHFLSG